MPLQKLFEDVCLGNLRLGSCKVFTFDCFVDLIAVNGDVARRLDPNFDAAGAYAEDRDFDVVAYDKTLIFFSRKYQHPYRHLRANAFPPLKCHEIQALEFFTSS